MPNNGSKDKVSKEADPHPRDSTEPQFTTTDGERVILSKFNASPRF